MIVHRGSCEQLEWSFIEVGENFPVEPTCRRLVKQAIKLPRVHLVVPYSYDTHDLLTLNLILVKTPSLRWCRDTRGVASVYPAPGADSLAATLTEKLSCEAYIRANRVDLDSHVLVLDGFCRGFSGRVVKLGTMATVEINLLSRVIELRTPPRNLKVLEKCTLCPPFVYYPCVHSLTRPERVTA